ncbi:phage recombination protein Bet [Candidatus Uhrbacteria bacterium]|nr:phage recombination protein Bet [Candidatus Uhrbacteria bacterium]
MTKTLAISAQDAGAIWQEQTKLAEVKKIYGKDLTDSEFAILVQIGQATHLNPFLREIWAVKYGTSPAQIFIGRDGYRKAAQSNPDYDYHLADAVYQNDDFKIEDGEVRHTYSGKDRGALVGAYCVVKRKSSTKTMFNFVDIKEYSTGKSLWVGKPATMIKKVAEAQGLRMAFQQLFAGTYDETEAWEEPAKSLPQPKEEKRIQPKTGEALFVAWNELWDLYMEKYPDERTDTGELKFSPEKSEATRKLTFLKNYKKESSTELTDKEAKDFICRCEEKIAELKKLPEPTKAQEVSVKQMKKSPALAG